MPASAREINKEVLSMRQWCWDMKRRGRGSRRTGKKLTPGARVCIGTGYPESELLRRALRYLQSRSGRTFLEAWSYAACLPNNLTNRRHIAALGSGGTSRAKASKFWEAAQRPVINGEKG